MSTKIRYGAIYWPLYSYKLLRSDLVHPGSADHEEIICPNLEPGTNNCRLFLGKNCAHINRATGDQCPYNDYHKFFLLDHPHEIHVSPPYPKFDLGKGYSVEHISCGSIDNKKLSLSLNFFPQHKKCKLNPTKHGPEWNDLSIDKLVFEQAEAEIKPNLLTYENQYTQREKFYSASEFVFWIDRTNNTQTEGAFLQLTDKQAVDAYLPEEVYDPTKDRYLPVAISFFGDGRVDGFLTLKIRRGGRKTVRDKVINFISQALGSLNKTILQQREMFLHDWCRQLRARVRQEYDASIGMKQLERDAIDTACTFGVNALKRMIVTLLAVKDHAQDGKEVATILEKIFKEKKDFDMMSELNSTCSNFQCFKKPEYYKKQCPDRCNFICHKFCNPAKISIKESFYLGKLKGVFAHETSFELMDIAKNNPISSRLLIRGGAASGKGEAAKDFHAHCMNRIAENLEKNKNEFQNKLSLLEPGKVKDEHLTQWSLLQKGKQLNHASKYISGIYKTLSDIKQLPPYIALNTTEGKWEFLREQITGIGWWRWGDENTTSPYCRDLQNCLKKLQTETDLDVHFIASMISLKILHEYSKREEADWSFNFFQVNCGIMGGQNSELFESVQRLFGQSGKAGIAFPGLFQICSYVGGTLFLDEIADAPVRIQDNLLRPLEEGVVSRPGWETINEKVENIRIVGATYKDLFKLASQYQATLSSGNPSGFRPDLLTRLTRNPPVTMIPIWRYFAPDEKHDQETLQNQFCNLMADITKLLPSIWEDVYAVVIQKLKNYEQMATKHIPDELERRSHFASKINIRLLKALKDYIKNEEARTGNETKKLEGNAKVYFEQMLDYQLCDS